MTASVPARVDLAGGWTDSPPIPYEYGGAVLNVAVRIDGCKPLGCRVRRIAEPRFVFSYIARPCRQSDEAEGKLVLETVVCNTLADLLDHADPEADMALLKSAVVAGGLVQTQFAAGDAPLALEAQLRRTNGGCGLEIQSWSALPAGSGLGGSSILGSTLLLAISRATGRGTHASAEVLVHDGIHLEAIACDDCGWQDQAGGVIGGVKYITSPPSLPSSFSCRTS